MPNTKQKRLEQIPEKDFTHLYTYHDYGVVENREARRMQQGSVKMKYAHELKLAHAAEQEARDAARGKTEENKNLQAVLAAVADLLPWRDFTKAMPAKAADEFGMALVRYWIDQGLPYYHAVTRVDLWWDCPTCKDDINADPTSGPHEHCEFANHYN